MKTKFKIRDLLATPFWGLALVLDRLAVSIGGEWTARLLLGKIKKSIVNCTK